MPPYAYLVVLLLLLHSRAGALRAEKACSPEGPRSDCGYYGIQQAECEQRGCCWSPTAAAPAAAVAAATTASSGVHGSRASRRAPHGTDNSSYYNGKEAANDIPWCFHPNAVQTVYVVQSVEKGDPGGAGAVTRLLLQLRPGPAAVPELGPDFEMLQVELQQQTPQHLYLRITPVASPAARGTGDSADQPQPQTQQQERWRVPEQLLPRPPPPTALPHDPLYELQLPQPGDDFSLRVTRRSAGDRAARQPHAKPSRTASGSDSGYGDRQPMRHTMSGAGEAEPLLEVKAEEEAEPRAAVQAAEPLLELLGGGCVVFKPQYLQLRLRVPADTNLYGMGETTLPEGLRLRRDGAPRALWNSDTPAAAVGVNLYGSHPMLYGIRPQSGGAAWGLFLANSNAMEFAAGSEDATFRLTGGELELWLLAGPSPEAVTRQYLQVAGRPALPPRWALGFHQSRYGYADMAELEAVVAGFEAAGLPLEVLWSDIDLYDRARMFTTDPDRYPEQRLRGLLDRLHASGRRWVPIVDCGITALPGQAYPPYERGLRDGVFLRDSGGREPLLGQVWSGPTHWPDFLHPNISDYWGGLLSDMAARLPYDGLWLDMNEPSNFCTGQCRLRRGGAGASANNTQIAGTSGDRVAGGESATASTTAAATATAAVSPATVMGLQWRRWQRRQQLGISCDLDCTAPSADDPLSNPPYAVNNGNRRAPLYVNTVPMNAVGYGGVRAYDSHNLYALAEVAITYGALQQILPGSRPFILTRSTWSGSGRYAAHWSGDNGASWSDLRRGGGSLLAASLAGLAVAGADVCGFWGDTTEQLCARWLAAGSFYTFTRDHSDHSPQEPYRFPAAAQAARNSLRARYALLPYLYTALYGVNTGRAGTVARPLAWEFPADPRMADLDTQWLLGDALLVAPVLQPDTDWTEVQFPTGPRSTWCRFSDLGDCHTGPAQHLVLSPLGSEPPLFLRAGAIIPTQPFRPAATTTAEVAASPLALTALLAPVSEASGGGGGGSSFVGGGSGEAEPRGATVAANVMDRKEEVVALEKTAEEEEYPDVDWAATGLLYADNGTDPVVDGPGCLRAVLRAGAVLAAGTGYLAYEVQLAPPPPPRGTGATGAGGAGSRGRGGGEGADTDVRLLRVAEVVVVGLVLPPGAGGFEVEVEGGQAPVAEQAKSDQSAEQPQVQSLYRTQSRSPVARRPGERAASKGIHGAYAHGPASAAIRRLRGGQSPASGTAQAAMPGARSVHAHTVGDAAATARTPVPSAAVEFDAVRQLLRVRGLDLSAVAPFRLVWRPHANNSSNPSVSMA
ncbi:hypothetical protein HYH02_012648 [Chlamydomonas schloesseri]|uniref:Maltase n=1 Tax=Chlamydomonas schloesseri TaxID=2026947 RepID=A0A835T6T3_9CHLO|nr:hypothetical protein HYH02_012648 [Chlamydomonas schloesseri]|eukprot:KAG2433530.1 hypothetical protein HYH02_012648 [Chlamydomonas schloesseri]